MKKSYFLSTTFNEVVFQNRNKIYGAYYLRRIYEKHVLVAVIIATAAFTLMLAAPLAKSMFADPVDRNNGPVILPDSTTIYEFPIVPPIPEKPKVEEPVVPAEKPKVKTEVYAETKVVRDDAPVETKELANYEDLKDATFGTEQIAGPPPTIPDIKAADTPPAGLGNGTEKAKPEIFIYVEEMPEFIGGEKAMLQYLSRKMKYPVEAQRIGIEGLVVVTFVVSKTGEIQEAAVIKGLGHGLDEEALRVVRSMPDWKPGKQNGRTVAVRYTLPIRFSIK